MPHTLINKTENRLLEFLDTLFNKMAQQNIRFAVIHNGDNLQDALKSDIDIALDEHPEHRVAALILEICNTFNFRLTNRLHYEIPHGYYYIIASDDNPPTFLHIDCLHDPIGVNYYYLPTNFLIEDCTSPNGFPQVSPEKTTLYLLVKRCFKPGLSETRYQVLSKNLRLYTKKVQSLSSKLLGPNTSTLIEKVARSNTPAQAEAALEILAHEIRKSFFIQHPLRAMARLLLDRTRKAGRLLKPSGFFLVLIGPDGCGKSTITTRLLTIMNRGYRRTWHFHWRPGLLPRLGGSRKSEQESDGPSPPSTVSKYKGPVSLIRFIYYSLDFILGYWLRIYPGKAQTTFIIGERYFPDVIVHPARYGFSTPHWLMRFTAFFIPDPDLVVLLSNDPMEIHQRKAELDPETIASQLTAYENEIPRWGKSSIVDTSGSPDEIASHIAHLIIDIQAEEGRT